jgi:hypothetical protein
LKTAEKELQLVKVPVMVYCSVQPPGRTWETENPWPLIEPDMVPGRAAEGRGITWSDDPLCTT